jgi:hypothetical protein
MQFVSLQFAPKTDCIAFSVQSFRVGEEDMLVTSRSHVFGQGGEENLRAKRDEVTGR